MSKESLTFISNTEQILDIYKTVTCHKFSFNEQKKLHIIFYEYKDKTPNNISILEIINTAQMISGLKNSLLEIINIYKSNLNLFEEINTYSVCHQEIQSEKAEYDRCYKEVASLKTRKIKNGNYADSAWYGGNKTEYEHYMKIDENLEAEINKALIEMENYDRLYKEKYENVMQYQGNIFSDIIELVNSYVSVLEKYVPSEKEKDESFTPDPLIESETSSKPKATLIVGPETIFRSGMYDKFLSLEQKLITDNYLNSELHWLSVHDNGKANIKRLVTFMVGLLDNRYFLPGKDPKIKTFFETRYHTPIGQNFERKRREHLSNEYKVAFYDYPF